MEKYGLSRQILDYYFKFAQNRDIEKYFRLRRSPSEGSVNYSTQANNEGSEFYEFNKNESAKFMSKSLDNLSTYKDKENKDNNSKMDGNDVILISDTTSDEDINQKSNKKVQIKSPKSDDNLSNKNEDNIMEFSSQIKQKHQKQPSSIKQNKVSMITKEKEEKTGKKYSFTCESNISINLPLPISISTDNQPSLLNAKQQSTSSAATQVEESKIISVDESSNTEEVKLDHSNCSSNDYDSIQQKFSLPLTKSGSAGKIEKRLEWDPSADIGYDKLSPKRRRRKNTMTTLEKSILKEFFANQGIEINFSIQEEKNKNRAHINLNQQTQLPVKSDNNLTTREKWRQVLENVKKKYNKDESKTNSRILSSFAKTIPNDHSTPREKTSEKYVQTSFIRPLNENKEIQVDITKQFSGLSTTTEGGNDDSLVSPSSFEYIRINQKNKLNFSENSDKENQNEISCNSSKNVRMKKFFHTHSQSDESSRNELSSLKNKSGKLSKYSQSSKSRSTQISEKESIKNNSLQSHKRVQNFKQSSRCDSSSSSLSSSKSESKQYSTGTLTVTHSSKNKSTLHSPKSKHKLPNSQNAEINEEKYNSTTTDSNIKNFNEIDFGMKLLCSLIEAKSLNNKQKKLLAKKIISKITKNKLANSINNKTPSTTPFSTSNTLSGGDGVASSSLINKTSHRTASQVGANDNNSGRILKTINLSPSKSTEKIKRPVEYKNSEQSSLDSDRNKQQSLPSQSSSNKFENATSPLQQIQKDGPDDKVSNVKASSNSVSINNESLVKNWLGNITKSEINYAKRKMAEKQQQQEFNLNDGNESTPTIPPRIDIKAGGDNGNLNLKGSPSSVVINYLENERRNHADWIDNEIKHLENLKKLLVLEKITNEKSCIPGEKIKTIVYPVHKKDDTSLHFYDKVATGSRNKNKINSTSSSSSTTPPHCDLSKKNAVELVRTESEVKIINPSENYTRKVKRQTDEIYYDKVNDDDDELKSNKNDQKKEKGCHLRITTYTIDEEKRFPKKDYLIRDNDVCEKKSSKRSKLKTPPNSCSNKSNSITTSRTSDSHCENQQKQQLYDSNHYSELRGDDCNVPCTSSEINRKEIKFVIEPYSSCNFSSGSMSLPKVCSTSSTTSTTTTTHCYDHQICMGVQTTDSLLRTRPIFGREFGCGCKNVCGCYCPKPTIREYQTQNNCRKNVQIEAKPCAEAYIIHFEKKETKKKTVTTTTPLLTSSSSKHGGDGEPSNVQSEYCLTLREHLQKERPDFNKRVNQRQAILDEMKKLRKERQRKIEEILENASDSSVSRKLNNCLPPPATKRCRIFNTKEMKAMTNRNYCKLPEYLEKVEREKNERKKRNYRVLTNVFNKRLQKRVHKGQLSLEHSKTVI